MKVYLVGGTRPNFVKIAALARACPSLTYPVDMRIIHTGQHFDEDMSGSFFHDLGIPKPYHTIKSGSGTHSEQTGKIMVGFEKLCEKDRPDLVIVVGDVNSTLACAIVAKKMGIKLAHVEAGLRSGDMSMPEEINRIVVDSLADYHFTTEPSASRNLAMEGHISFYFVGNTMIDNLFWYNSRLPERKPAKYGFLTLHRPSNVDNKEVFSRIVSTLNSLDINTIWFPMHPRTEKMAKFKTTIIGNIRTLPPLGYLDSLIIWRDAKCVFTDSGGLQEETSALGVPCVTIRNNTERPITVEEGSNVLAGTTPEGIRKAYDLALSKAGKIMPNCDGKASNRIWEILAEGLI